MLVNKSRKGLATVVVACVVVLASRYLHVVDGFCSSVLAYNGGTVSFGTTQKNQLHVVKGLGWSKPTSSCCATAATG